MALFLNSWHKSLVGLYKIGVIQFLVDTGLPLVVHGLQIQNVLQYRSRCRGLIAHLGLSLVPDCEYCECGGSSCDSTGVMLTLDWKGSRERQLASSQETRKAETLDASQQC
jgi:hypothetical protein